MVAADGTVAITAGSGTPIRAITGAGPNSADQQVITLAKSDGTLEAATAAGSIAVQTRVQGLTLTSGSISTATGAVTATTDVPNAGTVTVGIVVTTALVGCVLNFEASPDGTNWFPVIAQRTDTYETETTTPAMTLSLAAVRAWDIPLPGFTQFRVRASALTSGAITVLILPAVNGFEVAPSVGVAAAPSTEWNPPTVTSITTLGTFDAGQYMAAKVMLLAPVAWSGVSVTMECSNDNVSWYACPLINSTSVTGSALTSISFTGTFYGNLTGRYVRLRTTAYTSGTVQAIVEFTGQPIPPHAVGASVNQITATAALADGYANPTEGHLAAEGFAFNGSTWDRVRNNQNNSSDSGAKTVTFNGATQTNMNYRGATVAINVGTVSGTSPTMVAQLQGSADGGTTWYNITGAVTATITATGVYLIECYPGVTTVAGTATSGSVASTSHVLPRTWRVLYTIGGTSPSFTLTSAYVAYTL